MSECKRVCCLNDKLGKNEKKVFAQINLMAKQIFLQTITKSHIATTDMCAKFRDDPESLSRPARFHYKQKKHTKTYKKTF
jgi:hypothetical protein